MYILSEMTIQTKTDELKPIIEKLIALGEDQGELGLWLRIGPTMNEEAYASLLANLKKELNMLSNSC